MKLWITRVLYKNILKPILFLFDPTRVHNWFVKFGKFLGSNIITRKLTALFLYVRPKNQSITLAGINFPGKVGLAAGFDYDANLINILPSLGFGFHTVGTVTKDPYAGNPGKMLGRLPKSKSLLVNKGFKSSGVYKVIDTIKKSRSIPSLEGGQGKVIPLGMSIGSTNKAYNSYTEQVENVYDGFKIAMAEDLVDYYELNISCPNLVNIGNTDISFKDAKGLKLLLDKLNSLEFKRPVFLKMLLEEGTKKTEELLDVAKNYKFLTGVILSNLQKNRDYKGFDKNEIENAGKGNFSGKPVFEQSNAQIRFVREHYKDRFIIIGCGGIFSAEDAQVKIDAGADLVQLITGMIFEGPQLISEINKGLSPDPNIAYNRFED